MSKSKETPSTPTGDDRNLVAADVAAAAPDFEESVRRFWEKNRTGVYSATVVVLLVILGRYGWEMMQARQAESTRAAFALTTTDSQRTTFANENAGTKLAGVAWLEVADTAFKEGRYDAAISAYDSASKELDGSVFADRIRLGRAMAQMSKGDVAGAQSALRDLAGDSGAASAVRGEATYHLASMAAAEGDTDTLSALAAQLESIDPSSTWTQRVTVLQATIAPKTASSDITVGTP